MTKPEIDPREDAEVAHAQWCMEEPLHSVSDCPERQTIDHNEKQAARAEWLEQVFAAADALILSDIDPDGVYNCFDLDPIVWRSITSSGWDGDKSVAGTAALIFAAFVAMLEGKGVGAAPSDPDGDRTIWQARVIDAADRRIADEIEGTHDSGDLSEATLTAILRDAWAASATVEQAADIIVTGLADAIAKGEAFAFPRVTGDWTTTVFECASLGSTWNGWQTPSFTREQVEKVVADQVRLAGAEPEFDWPTFTWDGDVLIYTDPDQADEPWRIEPIDGLYDLSLG